MPRPAFILLMAALLAACAAGLPSVQVVRVPQETPEGIRLAFSTDRLTRLEVQEMLLLSSAIMARDAGAGLFQFRSVDAEGLTGAGSEEIRYFDVEAVVDPLLPGEPEDPVRKTYVVAKLIDAFGPRYDPVLPEVFRSFVRKPLD